jgi:DNA-directed RNA polymerase subunit RPC12/RpoP
MAVLLTFIIAFLIVGFLARKPAPRPKPLELRCPYCKRPATRITFSYDCSDCGKSVVGNVDLDQTVESRK